MNSVISKKNIVIGIGLILGVVTTVTLVLLVVFGVIPSNGCKDPKPTCASPATLTCSNWAWGCKCGGQSYVEATNGLTCVNPAKPTCSDKGVWSCMCGTESGSTNDQQTCQVEQGANYVCDALNNVWNCECNGTNLSEKRNNAQSCANYNGDYKCVSTKGTQPSWQCVCPNPATGHDEPLLTCGINETPECTKSNGWICTCGKNGAASDSPYGRNPDALNCNGTDWVSTCTDEMPQRCVGHATCVNNGGNWSWQCKCGAEELDKFIATSQCPARRGNITCDSSYNCSCVSVNDPNNPVSLMDCADGTGYCDNSGEIQCCLPVGSSAKELSNVFVQAYEDTVANLNPNDQVLIQYGVNVYTMINTTDIGNVQQRLQAIQNQFLKNLRSKWVTSKFSAIDPDLILEKLKTCTGLTKDMVKTDTQNGICTILNVLSNVQLVQLNIVQIPFCQK